MLETVWIVEDYLERLEAVCATEELAGRYVSGVVEELTSMDPDSTLPGWSIDDYRIYAVEVIVRLS